MLLSTRVTVLLMVLIDNFMSSLGSASDIFTLCVTEIERGECLFMEGRRLSVTQLCDNPTGNHIYFYLLSVSQLCFLSQCFRGSAVAAGKRPDLQKRVQGTETASDFSSLSLCELAV